MRATLVNQAITAAASLAVVPASNLFLGDSPRTLCIQGTFTYGSGGATVDAYVQTSVDGGATWADIAEFHFTTTSARYLFNLSSLTPNKTQVAPDNGTLPANTAQDGILGPLFQVLLASTGTYSGTSLRIDVSSSDR